MSNFDGIWTEKYRPTTLDGIVLSKEDRDFFNSLRNKQDIPHLLFAGTPGVGKCLHRDEVLEVFVSDELFVHLEKRGLIE
jgi:replication factor C small subunit